MNTLKKILLNVALFLLVWYGSQSVIGFLLGIGIAFTIGEMNSTAIMILTYGGLLTSIVSEVVFWGHRIVNKKEA